MLYNLNRDTEKDPTGWTWRDVYPEWQEEPREQTEQEMFDLMMSLAKITAENPLP